MYKAAAVLFCLQLLAVGASAQAEAFASAGDATAIAGAGTGAFNTAYVQPITAAFAGANPYNAAAAVASALNANQAASIIEAFTQVGTARCLEGSAHRLTCCFRSSLRNAAAQPPMDQGQPEMLTMTAMHHNLLFALHHGAEQQTISLVLMQAKASSIEPVVICDCYTYSQKINQAVGQACAEAIAGAYGGSTCSGLPASGAVAAAAAGK